MSSPKIIFLRLCKTLGLFYLSRFLMRHRLLILCYHSIALEDEHKFRPKLFMRESLFRQRLETIQRNGFPVLPLADTLTGLSDHTLPANSIAITIDDGFYSVLSKASPLLKERGLPATLYLTTYYAKKKTPIFRLAVQYMFWKSSVREIDLSRLPWEGAGVVSLDSQAESDRVCWDIIEYGESHCSEAQRHHLCQQLGQLLEVEYGNIVASRILSLVGLDDLPAVQASGIDIQLHTHRHRFPEDDQAVCRQEIQENRNILFDVLGEKKTHFCYPSGVWSRNQWPALNGEGIQSAATSDLGLNTTDTHHYRLYRVTDKEDLSQIEFEAELFGFSELARIIFGRRSQNETRLHSWHLDSGDQ